MPITSGLWWSVWWPWLVVWLVGAAALVLAVAIWLRHLRRYRYRQRIKPVSPTTFYYIDDAQVRQLLGEMSPTEVTEKRNSNMGAKLTAGLPFLSGGGGGGTEKGLTTTHTEQPTEIRAIRNLIETREQTDAIVYVDLRRGHVVENQALWKELARHGGHRPDSIRLSGLDPLVVLTARFKSIGGTKDKETFVASFDDHDDPTRRPRVRITCDRDRLLKKSGGASFPAHCLGRVRKWNSVKQELILEPVAIFE